jgi:hypothetical protein
MKNPHAVALGRSGGLKKSVSKAASSKQNGALGGRPPKRGLRNWVPFFDAVDEVRRRKSFASLEALLKANQRRRERALLNATARKLAAELHLQVPMWAENPLPLKQPFFVSGMENLKASALIESPPDFRMNNIFVLENFLSRV